MSRHDQNVLLVVLAAVIVVMIIALIVWLYQAGRRRVRVFNQLQGLREALAHQGVNLVPERRGDAWELRLQGQSGASIISTLNHVGSMLDNDAESLRKALFSVRDVYLVTVRADTRNRYQYDVRRPDRVLILSYDAKNRVLGHQLNSPQWQTIIKLPRGLGIETAELAQILEQYLAKLPPGQSGTGASPYRPAPHTHHRSGLDTLRDMFHRDKPDKPDATKGGETSSEVPPVAAATPSGNSQE